jgi:hypothetical protein
MAQASPIRNAVWSRHRDHAGGLELIDADVEKGTIKLAFTGTEDSLIPHDQARRAV